MKANRKGFTLIELLAVIVILAIILLIATPIILNVIEDARKGSAKSSAMFFVGQIEKQVMQDEIADPAAGKAVLGTDGVVVLTNVSVRGSKDNFVAVDGEDPLTYDEGKVNGYFRVKSGNREYDFVVTDGEVDFAPTQP